MKREKIYAMFRKKFTLKLFNKLYKDSDGKEKISMQYITDGRACYALENLPLFDDSTIRGLLGIDPNDKLECIIDLVPSWLEKALTDYDDSDVPLRTVTSIFGYNFLTTEHYSENDDLPEISCFVNPSYLAPLADEDLSLYSRIIDEKGTRWIVAKAGLITKAVIVPKSFHSEMLGEKIEWLKKGHAALILMQQSAAAESEENEIKLLEG